MTVRGIAIGAATSAITLAAASIVLTRSVAWSFAQTLDAYVTSNLVIGLAFALCGAFIAWHRPGHPVGWMYAVGGNLQLVTAATAPLAQLLQNHGVHRSAIEVVATLSSWAWPIHIGVVLPLSLLLLPDGRLPAPRWRPVFGVVAVTAPLFVLELGTGPSSPAGPQPFWVLPQTGGWATLWTLSEMRWVASMLVGLGALAWRFRRGDQTVRRQLLWILAAVVSIVLTGTPWALIAGTPIGVLFAIPLLPMAIALAIVRYGLLDIRFVVARALTYALLSGIVLAGYVVLVLTLSGVASALIVALLAFPLRARLQRAAEQLVYGDRDLLRLASRIGHRLVDLPGSLEEIRNALRLPFLAITAGGEVAATAGSRPDQVQKRLLRDDLGWEVGLRRGETTLGAGDVKVLDLLAGPLAVAHQATVASRDVQASRERLVTAREEERLRLRRDLHDGLGPLLTGVALAADAAANVAERDPVQARSLLAGVRRDTRTAISEVRRVVEDLRPPALAELGLAGALEARAAQTVRRADGRALTVTVDAVRGPLPPAVEVAAYRIATEALNNAVRHSGADAVQLRLWLDSDLHLEITDDGGDLGQWSAGVGLTAMRERAAELGGECHAGPSASGGAVRARLPLVVA